MLSSKNKGLKKGKVNNGIFTQQTSPSHSLNSCENPITLKELDSILSKPPGGPGPDGLPFQFNITFWKALRY